MRFPLLLAMTLFVTACDDAQPERASGGGGGGGGGGDGGGTSCSTSTALDDFAEAYAAAAARCDVGSTLSRGPISQALFADFLRANFAATLGPVLDAGRVRWNESNLCGAVAELSGDSCALTDDGWDLLDGTVPLGGECNWNDECAEGWCKFGAACPGVCAETLAHGAPCDSSSGCPAGATCSLGSGTETTCQAEPTRTFVSLGGDCTPTGSSCVRSYCDGTVCQPYPTPGQSCADTNRCDGGFCDTATDVCRLWLASGAACTETKQCSDGLFCDLTMDLPACKPLLQNGAACTDTGPSTSCASGICAQTGLCAEAFSPVACDRR